MTRQIVFTPSAEKDLILAKNFYAKIDPTLKAFGQFRMIARTFPFSIYYQIPAVDEVLIVAVLDNRVNPETMAQRLGK